MGKRESRTRVKVPAALDSVKHTQLAKLSIPKLQAAIHRERLFALLDEQLKKPFVWIHAPPGAGKTTLVGTYLERSSRTVLWYRADAGDADLPTVFYYLREAALSVKKEASVLPLLSPEYLLDVPTFARNYFRTLFGLFDDTTVLVIDNYQDAGEGILDSVVKAAVAELPNHINLIVLSRSAPPTTFTTLQLQKILVTIDWEKLRLTLNEAQAIAAEARITDLKLVQALYADCDGWIAGLVLLLEYAKQVSMPQPQIMVRACEKLFNYFSNELFAALPSTAQHLVLCTALLPSFTVSQAAVFANTEEAEQILGWLYKRNFFIDCREGTERTYQYHALFREFLLERGKNFFSTEQRQALLLQSVSVFENNGQTEAALLLAIEATAWNDAARLTCVLAPKLLQQGRFSVLERWITTFPEPILNQSSWLLYWLGVARLPFDPAHGRSILEQAYAQFEQQGNALACLLSCSSILQSFFFEWGDQHPIDAWLEVFRGLIQNPDACWPNEIKMQALPCLAATVLRHTGDPLLEWGADSANALAYETSNPEQQVPLAFFVVAHSQMIGRWRRGAELLQHMDKLWASSPIAPLQSLQWSVLKITWSAMCSLTCSESHGRDQVNQFIEVSESSGIRVLDVYGLSQGIYFALIWRDVEMASRLLERMRTSLSPHRIMDVAHFHWLQTAIALERGDLVTANDSMRLSMEKVLECGARFGLAQNRLLLAQLHFVQGNVTQALQEVQQTIDYARTASSWTFEHAGLLVKAYILLNSNQPNPGQAALCEGLALGKKTGQSVIAPHALARITSFLYSEALNQHIEVEYVRTLIQAFNIQPAFHDVSNWPWPIRIYTLGRFTVLCDDKPIKSSSKAQKKPLDLLRMLIALGGRSVNIDDIMNVVWPDERGAARTNFDVALMRLRKLLVHPEALALTDGKLTLNDQVCSVDSWTFERAVTRLDATPDTDIDAKIFDLYRGAFLNREHNTPCIENMRDRLAAKFQRITLRFGKVEEQALHWEAAAHFYQRGLEQDNLHEEFYRRLMTCQCQLGQHAEAIKTYRRCRSLLSINLGTQPAPETDAVYQRALAERIVA